jgi:trk system potassium uptake protein
MDLRLVAHFLGKIAFACGIVLLLPFGLAIFYAETSRAAFLLAILVCLLLGVLLWRFGQQTTDSLRAREGIAITGLGWLLVTFLGMLPYVFGGYLGILDGVFESISGFTGTGATVINALEQLPQSILMWRSLTHWLGGLGIIVIFIAILPQIGYSAVYMYNAEISGPAPERVLPRLKEMAWVLFLMYVLFTSVAAVVYWLCGLDLLSAVNHAFSTIATGGFSTYDANAIHFNNPLIEGWMTFFMVLAGGNFGLYYRVYQRGFAVLGKNTEFKAYIGILLTATLLVMLNLLYNMDYSMTQSLRYASFQVASIATTGFVSADFDRWPSFSKAVLMLLMFTGGCAGSTAGGIKISRIVLLVKMAGANLRQQLHPHAMMDVHMNGVHIGEETLHRAAQFFFVYMMFVAFWALLLMSEGELSMFDAIGLSVTTMGSVGPGFGVAGATCTYSGLSNFTKVVLCLAMLLGRLEMFTFLVMLRPAFWRRSKGW